MNAVQPQLEVVGVTKRYTHGKEAVSDLTMRLDHGVLGLVGPNGAGKSSLMRILATVTRPTSGHVTWNGTDIVRHPDELRRALGYLPQDFGVYPNLSAREFLSYLAACKGIRREFAKRRIGELLESVNLSDTGRKPMGRYSGGMRQRVGIAQALLNDPRLLIVDEPTAGLDPEERVRFRNLLGDLAADRIVILSTHIVSDVEAVTDDIAVMANGRLRYRGAGQDLLRAAEGRVWEFTTSPSRFAVIRQQYAISRAIRSAEGVRVRALSPDAPAPGAVPITPDLEDAYLWLVNRMPVSYAGQQIMGQGQ